jgi:hypothetical protein
MCALCGVIGGYEHWTDAAPREGTFSSNTGPIERRRERSRRVTQANRILKCFNLALRDWQGQSFLLSTMTGKTEIIGGLGELGAAAETLLGRPIDPLDELFLSRMEKGA